MSESTRKARLNGSSVSADVTRLRWSSCTRRSPNSPGSPARLGADLVNDAIRSATVVTDAVQDMAADMAVSA